MLYGSDLTGIIIGAAIEVHRYLGPGLLESVYEQCLAQELRDKGLSVSSQQSLPIIYKGNVLDASYRIDLVVNQQVILELKAVQKLEPIHKSQLLTYLKLSNINIGLLLNFNVPKMKDGIHRVMHN
ncbi:MAG: GxxExxY protein [Algicola sp.]|nr:GxxExxY protein [Algicola sp.]